MATVRLPGPLGILLRSLSIDTGTLCRMSSPWPGNVGLLQMQPGKPTADAAKGLGTLKASDFEAAARLLDDNIDPRLIQAFAEVESGGKSGFGPDGLPVIAFEGHIFRKLTKTKSGEHPFDKDYPRLSHPYKQKAGPEWKANNKDQKTAWDTLKAAIALNENAALQSCSWGMFQVMGFNFGACGYVNVNDFVVAMKGGEQGQLNAFVGYCKSRSGMVAALRAKQFASMATLYNGSDYGDYDKRIERAYKKHGGK